MYEQDSLSALDAITEAQRIAFAPMLFQTALCLRNADVLAYLDRQGKQGATLEEITENSHVNEYAVGVLLDMGLMNVTAPQLQKFDLSIPDMSKDYNQIFRFNTDATYTQGFTNAFSSSSFSGFGYGYGWGMTSSPQFMQMGSFKLKNGMRLNTYGDYDKDGWRVPNRSAMPWEKNNFRGAFELKSANGNFGIRIEVQQGRNVPY